MIKNYLLDLQRQQDAIHESYTLLAEYKLFSSLSPMKYDYNNKETKSCKA